MINQILHCLFKVVVQKEKKTRSLFSYIIFRTKTFAQYLTPYSNKVEVEGI